MDRVGIKEVARLAGVSTATVSRVLNRNARVSPEKKEKVLFALESTGFRRNLQASGLRAKQSFIITLLYSTPGPSYVTALQKGALGECNANGYRLSISPCDHRSEDFLEQVDALITNFEHDGLIITPPLCDIQEVIQLVERRNVNYVRISPFREKLTQSSVYSDDTSSSYGMTQYLISLGHQRIGFIEGPEGHSASANRLNGYKQALDDNGISYDPELIEQGQFTFESGEICARKLLKVENRPTAIFASNDNMAAAVMKVASQMKLQVPSQLSVAGFDDATIATKLWPRLTTVKQPVEQMAAYAVKKLLSVINKKDADRIKADFECEIIIRESTSPLTS